MAATIALMGTDAFREGLAFILSYVSTIWNKCPYPLQLLLLTYFCYSLSRRLWSLIHNQEV